jgi:lysozyme family protein
MANFKDIKELTLKWEGGLSRASTDTARLYPSPYVHNGLTGWHTNKGITYQTFEAASKKLGFKNNSENFINMPDVIWDSIAKGLYWDELKLDSLKSNGVAFQLFSWNWGAGTGWFPRMKRYLTSKGIEWNEKKSTLAEAINKLIDKQGEKQTISDLDKQQQEFYASLNQPANFRGWINRIKETTSYAYSFLGRAYNENKQTLNYGLLGIGIILISFASYLYNKKK